MPLGFPTGTKAWFFQNTAPIGWTIDATVTDDLLAVKGGTQAYKNTEMSRPAQEPESQSTNTQTQNAMMQRLLQSGGY